ncbi:K+/H+ antiporter subunit F [Sandaracinobacteroides sp. A072]|uniref:K+/H+ antiporter subunit F n=1 Tax=Sandaracinobacteroides sp. A072 TaxID=3461146 RepID=UPI0040424CA8
MLSLLMPIALVMLGLAILMNLLRLMRGPTAEDRVLALDTLTVNAIAVVMLLGITLGTSLYFEAALILAMMGFVGTVALCKFLLGGDVIE